MNIDNLTFGEIKQIAAMFGTAQQVSASHPMVGRYVIVRCSGAGVHAGVLVSQDGNQAILKDSRRLWFWKAKNGIALSGLSQFGLQSGKVDTVIPEIALIGVIEIIPCSEVAKESINAA